MFHSFKIVKSEVVVKVLFSFKFQITTPEIK